MKKGNHHATNAAALRRRAEEQVRAAAKGTATSSGDADVRKLLHELQVHQIELEMQNAALQQTADELATALERYTDLYEFAPVGYLTIDRKGIIHAANLTAASLMGVDRSRLVGRSFPPLIGVESRDSFIAFLNSAFEGKGREACEVSLLRDGPSPLIAHIEATLSQTGQECRLGIIDVTEEKQLQAQILASQKLAAIGRLAGGVAHEFRNQLTVIRGYAEMLLRQPLDAEQSRAMFESILRAADRSASVAGQLLAFSRKDMLQPCVVNMASLVSETAQRLQMLVGDSVRIVVTGEPGNCPVNVSASQFEQAMMNLAANARDAMPRGGLLKIAIANIDLGSQSAAALPDATPGPYVRVSVSDDGCGMTEETLARMFEPFFTTKDVGAGTGLGLASVYGFIRQSGGFITVRSEPGKGTTFDCHFPRVQGSETPVRKSTAPPPVRPGTETILVAEDERPIRRLLAKVLGDAGYRVLEACNANEALVVAERHRGRIEMLIADVVMPGVSGLELAWQLRKKWPEMPALFISGHDSAELLRRGIDVDQVELIDKPFAHAQLLGTVRRMLDAIIQPAV
jgi:PAS domain S-box-containing protein